MENLENQLFYQAATAASGKYRKGSYGQIQVYRVMYGSILPIYMMPLSFHSHYQEFTQSILTGAKHIHIYAGKGISDL